MFKYVLIAVISSSSAFVCACVFVCVWFFSVPRHFIYKILFSTHLFYVWLRILLILLGRCHTKKTWYNKRVKAFEKIRIQCKGIEKLLQSPQQRNFILLMGLRVIYTCVCNSTFQLKTKTWKIGQICHDLQDFVQFV